MEVWYKVDNHFICLGEVNNETELKKLLKKYDLKISDVEIR